MIETSASLETLAAADAMGRQLLLRLRSAETALAHAQDAHQRAEAALRRHVENRTSDSATEGPLCRSDIHTQRGEDHVVATHQGTFDCSVLNGAAPEPGSWYCTRCATALHEIGYFKPNPGQPPLGSLADLIHGDMPGDQA